MAEKCAGCGSAQYLQAQVNTYECLKCGALTEMATGELLPKVDKPPVVSNGGYPVRELSTSTAGDVGAGEDRRNRAVGTPLVRVSAAPFVAPLPARADLVVQWPAEPAPAPEVDSIEAEQAEALRLIAEGA